MAYDILTAQDIYAAGISLLSLLIGRKRVFSSISPEAHLCEMALLYGTRAMENLGIYSKICLLISSKISKLVIQYIFDLFY